MIYLFQKADIEKLSTKWFGAGMCSTAAAANNPKMTLASMRGLLILVGAGAGIAIAMQVFNITYAELQCRTPGLWRFRSKAAAEKSPGSGSETGDAPHAISSKVTPEVTLHFTKGSIQEALREMRDTFEARFNMLDASLAAATAEGNACSRPVSSCGVI